MQEMQLLLLLLKVAVEMQSAPRRPVPQPVVLPHRSTASKGQPSSPMAIALRTSTPLTKVRQRISQRAGIGIGFVCDLCLLLPAGDFPGKPNPALLGSQLFASFMG